MFSSRTPGDLRPNRLARALATMRAEGTRFLDLTTSNPTTAGFSYPGDYLRTFEKPAAYVYEPNAFGLPDARAAVARDYTRREIVVDPAHVVLSASTSEAYSLLFKLLCDPGDEILVPQPSYPLFDHLVGLEGCVGVPYDVTYDGRWAVDEDSVDEAMSSRTRAILAVSPNNPTGSFLTRAELDALLDRCRHDELALIVDEVFFDYVLDDRSDRASAAVPQDRALAFSLGGLSKAVGLPHLKLAWFVMSGPGTLLEPASRRLEMICDTYLSVGTPVQHAAADLMARGRIVREQIQTRLQRNLTALRAAVATPSGCELLHVEGGWYASVRVPASRTEEDLVLSLLTEERVLVHPGYFFDFPEEAYLVFSLLTDEGTFEEGSSRVFRKLKAES